MIPRAFQFRRFSHRLLVLFVGLLFAALATTYVVVTRANVAHARETARTNLELASRLVDSAIRQRIDSLAVNARVLSNDYAFKQVFSDDDRRTIASALVSFAGRVSAPVLTFHDTQGQFVTASDRTIAAAHTEPFRLLIAAAAEKDLPQHSGLSYLNGQLHVLLVVPFYAPHPEIFGWFGLAFPLDRDFVGKIRALSDVELTYLAVDDPAHPRLLATTLPTPAATAAAEAAARTLRATPALLTSTAMVALPEEHDVTLLRFPPMLARDHVALVLQRPPTELATARQLESTILLTSLAALAAATLLALFIARSVSRPVVALVGHTQRIARGDYSVRNTTYRPDELGRLSLAFDDMARGLDERDRVRDLLDKNVSPEVAAALLRDGAILGGQEREVTILFADLRGFTTLSEKLTPQELLTLLNRYLDRMSAAIESHGGVIDKFIGDAIMALFGAPVAQSDAADRALAAALAMEKALVQLNTELAAEGIAPLAIGIGVNTARVVAGNIGSSRRLNYSVIGDGVNVASRLQSLTRTAEYRTNLITSAATLAALGDSKKFVPRPLGRVPVKGRAEPVEIFAVE